MNKKLAIITTHPVQYYAPLFKEMAKVVSLKVYYTWGQTTEKFDPGFGKNIAWDIPLLDGYEYTFVKNTSNSPGSSHFKGIVNPSLNSEVEQWGAAAVLIFGWSYHSHLKALRYFKGKIPVYFRGDSTLLDEKPGVKTLLRRLLLTWVYKHIDRAFYVGKSNREYFLKHGLDPQKLIFAPHAIDNERFKSNEEENSKQAMAIRSGLNISADEVVILFAGKFEEKKNPLLLLKAFKELNLKNAHLVFVGNGKLEDELKLAASGTANIHFLPFQNQSSMPSVYRIGDVFCLPSKGPGETWGLAVNEAMASSLSIIISDKCGCAMDLVDDLTGMVFKSEDIEELKSALLKFSKKTTAIKSGIEACKKIEGFSIKETAQKISANLF